MSSAHLDRALILIEQSRYDLADRELRQTLAMDPDNAVAHALLGLCLAQREQYQEAIREAEEAIRLAPDLSFAHYVLASVLLDRERLPEAEAAIAEAIRLDPEEADYRARLAGIRYAQRRWQEALVAAEEGLAIDPIHAGCANLRAMALVQLGRREEAGTALQATLARDPENAVTHANQGWALLHRADYAQALTHFREALRLDPGLEWAREGIVEALKAKHFLYGLMLRYFLWMSRLSGRARWMVLIGGFLGFRLLRDVARANPALAPLIVPVLVVYFAFFFFTWLADPLFNLVLRLDRFGRLALSREQVVASNWVGGTLLAALLCVGAWLVTTNEAFGLGAIAFAGLSLPVAGAFTCRPGWPRLVMAIYTGLVALIGLAGVSLGFFDPRRVGGAALTLVAFSVLGSLLSTWLANGLSLVSPKR